MAPDIYAGRQDSGGTPYAQSGDASQASMDVASRWITGGTSVKTTCGGQPKYKSIERLFQWARPRVVSRQIDKEVEMSYESFLAGLKAFFEKKRREGGLSDLQLHLRRAAELASRLSDFLGSEGNRQRWFTRDELESCLGLRTEKIHPYVLDQAFGYLALLECTTTKQDGPNGERLFRWFPWRQLRLPLGTDDLRRPPGSSGAAPNEENDD